MTYRLIGLGDRSLIKTQKNQICYKCSFLVQPRPSKNEVLITITVYLIFGKIPHPITSEL